MQNILARAIFEVPFQPDEKLPAATRQLAENKVWNNSQIMAEVARCKAIFTDKQECLTIGHFLPEAIALTNSIAKVSTFNISYSLFSSHQIRWT